MNTYLENSEHPKVLRLNNLHENILNGIIDEVKVFEKSLNIKNKRKLFKQKRTNAQKQHRTDSENMKLLKQYPDDYWPK